MKEQSKVFKQMGRIVGIPAERKTQRGVIAKNFLPLIVSYEITEFSKQLVRIKPKTKGIIFTRFDSEEVNYL
jgi:hypothetical protein